MLNVCCLAEKQAKISLLNWVDKACFGLFERIIEDRWIGGSQGAGIYHILRREMIFPDPTLPRTRWMASSNLYYGIRIHSSHFTPSTNPVAIL